MTPEMFDDSNERRQPEADKAELEVVSQETLVLLLEEIRTRCLTGLCETMGSGGLSFKGVQHKGRPIGLDLYYYGNSAGPTRHDTDGTMSEDTTARYKHSHDSFYYDTGVQATVFKTEKAEEPLANGGKLLTSYTIINNGQQLEIDKRVHFLQLPIFLKLGNRLVPKEDNPPPISTQALQAARQQEDELGISSVPESEANDLHELIRDI